MIAALLPFVPLTILGVLIAFQLLQSPVNYLVAAIVLGFMVWLIGNMWLYMLDTAKSSLENESRQDVIEVTRGVYDGLRERVGDAEFARAKQWAETDGYTLLARAATAELQRLGEPNPLVRLSLEDTLDCLADAYKRQANN